MNGKTHYTMTPAHATVWVVFCKSPHAASPDAFCHAFDSEDSARTWVLRTKLDKGVRALVGSIPQFRIEEVSVKSMAEARI